MLFLHCVVVYLVCKINVIMNLLLFIDFVRIFVIAFCLNAGVVNEKCVASALFAFFVVGMQLG